MRSEHPGIPNFVVSASAYPEIRKALLHEGVLDYVIKPFDASSFEQVCNSLIKMFPELKLVSAHRTSAGPSKTGITAPLKRETSESCAGRSR